MTKVSVEKAEIVSQNTKATNCNDVDQSISTSSPETDSQKATELNSWDAELQQIHTDFNNFPDAAFDEMASSGTASSAGPATPPASPTMYSPTSSRSSSRSSCQRRRRKRPEAPQTKAKDTVHTHAMQVLDALGLEHDIMVYLEPGKYHLHGDKSRNIVLQHRGPNLMVAGGGGYVPFATYLQTRHHPLVSSSAQRDVVTVSPTWRAYSIDIFPTCANSSNNKHNGQTKHS
jgi:hypothetical protein